MEVTIDVAPLPNTLPATIANRSSPFEPSMNLCRASSSTPSKSERVMKFSTPAMASDPYVAAAPSRNTSIRSRAATGSRLTSTRSCAWSGIDPGDHVMRRLLSSTSDRLGPRPRRFTVARSAPVLVPYWSDSPSAPWLKDRLRSRSMTPGEPWARRSSQLIRVTGNGSSSGVPGIQVPVTTNSSMTPDASCTVVSGLAGQATDRAASAARTLLRLGIRSF